MTSNDIDVERIACESFIARVEHHLEVTSTNDVARERAGNCVEADLPLLVIAERQTAGRGRQGRAWWTGHGALAFSLLIDPRAHGIEPPAASRTPLAVAVTLVRVFSHHAGDQNIGLHWPNDVICSGRKLSGVLIESLPDGRQVVGVGINVNNTLATAPPELQSVATSLRDLAGREIDRSWLLLGLLDNLHQTLRQLGDDPVAIARQCNDHCLQRGATLKVETLEGPVVGRCLGIADDGGLVIETAAGPRTFYAGEAQHVALDAGRR